MVKLKITFTLILVYVVHFAFSQASLSDKFKEKFITASYYLLYERYDKALPTLLELYDLDPTNSNINYLVGRCYLESRAEKVKAIPYLETAVKNVSTRYKDYSYKETRAPEESLYRLGVAYHINNDYESAITYYKKFKSYLSPRDVYNMDIVNRQIETCRNAKEILSNPVIIVTNKLGKVSNNKFGNYNPVVSADQSTLVFTTEKTATTRDSITEENDTTNIAEKVQEVFFCKKQPDGKWSEPVDITQQLKSNGFCSSVFLSPRGTHLFLFRDEYYDGNIYESKFINDQWAPIKKLNKNINSKSWEMHASIDAEEKTMYFSSDRKGGYGGFDIYYSVLDVLTGEWGPAKNLGPTINTRYDDDTPFISEDGNSLYFSSEGHYNMGGFDIFFSQKLPNGKWSSPLNLGYPINSGDDNLFLSPVSRGEFTYFAFTPKDGGVENEVCLLKILIPENPNEYEIKGTVSLQDKKVESSDSIRVSVADSLGFDTLIIPDVSGKYFFTGRYYNYKVTISAYSYLTKVEYVVIPRILSRTQLAMNSELSPDLEFRQQLAMEEENALAEQKVYEDEKAESKLLALNKRKELTDSKTKAEQDALAEQKTFDDQIAEVKKEAAQRQKELKEKRAIARQNNKVEKATIGKQKDSKTLVALVNQVGMAEEYTYTQQLAIDSQMTTAAINALNKQKELVKEKGQAMQKAIDEVIAIYDERSAEEQKGFDELIALAAERASRAEKKSVKQRILAQQKSLAKQIAMAQDNLLDEQKSFTTQVSLLDEMSLSETKLYKNQGKLERDRSGIEIKSLRKQLELAMNKATLEQEALAEQNTIAKQKAAAETRGYDEQLTITKQKADAKLKALDEQKVFAEQTAATEIKALDEQKALNEQIVVSEKKSLEEQAALVKQSASKEQIRVAERKALEEKNKLEDQKLLAVQSNIDKQKAASQQKTDALKKNLDEQKVLNEKILAAKQKALDEQILLSEKISQSEVTALTQKNAPKEQIEKAKQNALKEQAALKDEKNLTAQKTAEVQNTLEQQKILAQQNTQSEQNTLEAQKLAAKTSAQDEQKLFAEKIDQVRQKAIENQKLVSSQKAFSDTSEEALVAEFSNRLENAEKKAVDQRKLLADQKSLENLKVNEMEYYAFRKIYFTPSDSIELDSKVELERFSKLMEVNPNLKIEILGHNPPADSVSGTSKHSHIVTQYLSDKGIGAGRMHTKDLTENKENYKSDSTFNDVLASVELRLLKQTKDSVIAENIFVPESLVHKNEMTYTVLLLGSKEKLGGDYFKKYPVSNVTETPTKDGFVYTTGLYTKKYDAVKYYTTVLDMGFTEASILNNFELENMKQSTYFATGEVTMRDTTTEKRNIEFTIQLKSSVKQIDLASFKGLKVKVNEHKGEDGTYRYIYGSFYSFRNAKDEWRNLVAVYPEAFIMNIERYRQK